MNRGDLMDGDSSEVSDDVSSQGTDTSEVTDEDSHVDTDEEDPWDAWINVAYTKFKVDMKKKAVKLKNEDDATKEDAYKLTMEEFRPRLNEEIRKSLLAFLQHHHLLSIDPTYKKIMQSAQAARDGDDMDWDESVNYAIEQRKFLLDKLLRQWIFDFDGVDDEDDDEDADDEEDEDDDDDNEDDDGDDDDHDDDSD